MTGFGPVFGSYCLYGRNYNFWLQSLNIFLKTILSPHNIHSAKTAGLSTANDLQKLLLNGWQVNSQ